VGPAADWFRYPAIRPFGAVLSPLGPPRNLEHFERVLALFAAHRGIPLASGLAPPPYGAAWPKLCCAGREAGGRMLDSFLGGRLDLGPQHRSASPCGPPIARRRTGRALRRPAGLAGPVTSGSIGFAVRAAGRDSAVIERLEQLAAEESALAWWTGTPARLHSLNFARIEQAQFRRAAEALGESVGR